MKYVIVLLFLGLFINYTKAEPHGHHHENSSLMLNNGKKWSADLKMKQNMTLIKNGFNQIQELVVTKNVKDSDYFKLSNIISHSAQKIVQNCKMEEKADQTFHVILGELLSISEDLKKPTHTKDSIEQLNHVLTTYSEYFDQ